VVSRYFKTVNDMTCSRCGHSSHFCTSEGCRMEHLNGEKCDCLGFTRVREKVEPKKNPNYGYGYRGKNSKSRRE
jgi:predicted nucleic acid binding AN1-type Zn finger protein